MARSIADESCNNLVQLDPQSRSSSCSQATRGVAGLTAEEAIEFEMLDALPPVDDDGNIAWVFEGGPTSEREKRWLELYQKKGDAWNASSRGENKLPTPR